MPHKHVRSKSDSKATFNIPPTERARSLPVGKAAVRKAPEKKKGSKTDGAYNLDDTPKAFSRLLQRQSGRKTRSGLDNGDAPSKKRKRTDEKDHQTSTKEHVAPESTSQPTTLKILPGEKFSDFAARVDQALPVSGLARRGNGERQTKTEKRLKKMYAEWRKEDERRKEKVEEERELAEEEADEEDALLEDKTAPMPARSKKRKGQRVIGEVKADDDPWAALKATRDKPKGLHDVAQAPPEFTKLPKEKFKVRNGAVAQVADVPNAAGSLKRREELGEARKEIIEQYRAMMARGSQGSKKDQ